MLNDSRKQNGVNANGPGATEFPMTAIPHKEAVLRCRIQAPKALAVDVRVRFGVPELTREHFNVEHAVEW
jgi:hypothetical protein